MQTNFKATHYCLLVLNVLLGMHLENSVVAQDAALEVQFLSERDVHANVQDRLPGGNGFCSGCLLPSHKLEVDKKTRGIKNIVIIADIKSRNGNSLPSSKYTLSISKCNIYEPEIIVTAGDKLCLNNLDPIAYDIHIAFFKNASFEQRVPPNSSIEIEIQNSEPGAILVSSSSHPWITANLHVLPHRFAAVSDAEGRIEIRNLPEKLMKFKVFHARALDASNEVHTARIDANGSTVRPLPLELNLARGLNDLGSIVLPSSEFQKDAF
ncbi:hypothetical protein [Novipirellula sp.]|uniref:hypothetical protein n=1 Tax=Novipirellula sp. TaxID=2795430 RepID=UPI003564F6D3